MEINRLNDSELVKEIEIKLTKEDYLEKVEAELKKLRKTTQVPGFRVGNAPMGMVKKMYEKSVIADTVNSISSESLFKYVDDNKINFIFEPLINEEKSNVNYDENAEFTFVYELAMHPEINVDLTQVPATTYLKVVAGTEEIDRLVEGMRKEYGTEAPAEVVEENCATITVNIPDFENPVVIGFDKMNEVGKAKFMGTKAQDVVTADFATIFESEFAMKQCLHLEEVEAENPYTYSATVVEMTTRILADVNEELYKKAFPKEEITTEEAFRAQLAIPVETHFVKESDTLFYYLAMETIIKNNPIALPEDFIKRFILRTNQEITQEQLDAEYQGYENYLRANLVQGEIAKMGEITVTIDDIKKYMSDFYFQNYFSYMPEENREAVNKAIDGIVEKTLKDEKQVKQVYDMLLEGRIAEFLKTKVAMTEATCSPSEFNERSKAELDKITGAETAEAPKKEKKERAPRAKKETKTEDNE